MLLEQCRTAPKGLLQSGLWIFHLFAIRRKAFVAMQGLRLPLKAGWQGEGILAFPMSVTWLCLRRAPSRP
ncbi:hypothetical protein CLI92_10605 [Vandammella animalimorsus]|uniref:Uncharacterized protein n=1 Tax=Vandammella animalimorsus TaxID=2029117 RepID=A0A2A2T3M3_9BURK|nr:hypothetical protein CK626_04150 [Vandammella animalimorsus]PAX16028.1 hypothetical protein CLI92_10605 [Vandammella animalimorsus]PAX20277.1 hypothetical protein CLI93_00470 [Vandammella animalimorsus]